MSRRAISMNTALYDYLLSVTLREPELLRRLREETAKLPNAGMQISPDQGQFMALLIEMLGATRCLEIGSFTGYSALCVTLAMPRSGRLVAFDRSVEWTDIARRYWTEAGVADRIDLRLGPAVDGLDTLLGEGATGTFDFAFIDADKDNYDAYYERVLRLLRPGGLVAIDNVLWSGRVADPKVHDADTDALRALNQKVHADRRVSMCLLPVGDGLTLARKRG
ncbi:MAG: SAM-dependent methyltransferase [Rhodospirillaceae bacterium]|nr:SAM-dependent methyltransferase [Rhodospirillaceae bacterium]